MNSRTETQAERPVNLKLVLAVVVVVALAIVGYGLFTGTDPLNEAIEDPVITGTALLEFDGNPLADASIGAAMPVIAGTDFVGSPVELGPTGRPQIILFLAHWCGHCQNEVPLVQAWIDGGGLGDDVDLFSVASGISADADNYPPDAWLEREGWTPEVLVDTTDDVARAYGLSGFPYWVFVDGDGAVRGRWAGPIAIDDLAVTVGQLSG